MLLKSTIAFYVLLIFISLMFLGCTSNKSAKKQTIPEDSDKRTTQTQNTYGNTTKAIHDYGFDNHEYISLKPGQVASFLSSAEDSLAKTGIRDVISVIGLDIKSPVADKIVSNYLNSENKEPKGHCLAISKGRFETAYKQVHGHLPYQDLPDSMASKLFTPKQVFNLLYASASAKEEGWWSLPERYRGKGNAGAIAYAGMGTLVDTSGIWSGELRPGALMQVWRYKEDYELVVQGTDVKKLDPYGHSFIFISYLRNENNEIIGLQIADQGFQSYRPLTPDDYEVWWGVNLSI